MQHQSSTPANDENSDPRLAAQRYEQQAYDTQSENRQQQPQGGQSPQQQPQPFQPPPQQRAPTVDPATIAQEASSIQQVLDERGLAVQNRFLSFLQTYRSEEQREEPSQMSGTQVIREEYVYYLEVMRNANQNTIMVQYRHLVEYNIALAEAIKSEYYRFLPFLEAAAQNFVKIYHPQYAENERGPKDFHVSFYGLPVVAQLRTLVTDKIGQLVSFTGTVTRTSEVRPELLYGWFKCNECGTEIPRVEQQFKYTEPTKCTHPECSNRRSWELILSKSKFVDWQRVKCQENAAEIPAGSMPRSMDLIMRNEVSAPLCCLQRDPRCRLTQSIAFLCWQAVELVKAGDKCVFTGTLVVLPDVAQL